MRDNFRKALPPQALRRNRMVLACSLFAVGLLGGAAATCLIASDPQAGPLLLAVDEMAIAHGRGPSALQSPLRDLPARPHTVQTPLFRPFTLSNAIELKAPSTEMQATELFSMNQAVAIEDRTQGDPNLRAFNGRPIRPVGTMKMVVTAYSPDEQSCGDSADGITASGYSVWTNNMKMAAADTDLLPFGTLLSVPGYDDGRVVPVLDRGGAIKGNRLDVLYPTHEIAKQWGVQELEVTIWEYADGLPDDFQTQHHVTALARN